VLDLVKLSGQLSAFAHYLQQESKASQERLRRVWQEFACLWQEPRLWQPCWVEWGSLPKVEPLQEPHTVVATDGSQIPPDHLEVAYSSGQVTLHYGTQEWPLLGSQPLLLYGEEPLKPPERSNFLSDGSPLPVRPKGA
jgi:hypothetical protein